MSAKKRRGAPKGSRNHAGRGPVQTGKRPAKGQYSSVGTKWMEDDPTGKQVRSWLKGEGLSLNEFWRRWWRYAESTRHNIMNQNKGENS